MRFVERERLLHAGVTQDIERKDEVEGILRKGKFVHARGNKPRAGLAPGRKFQGMSALIYPGQIGQGKFFPHHSEHSSGAATGIEQGEVRSNRLDGIGDMLDATPGTTNSGPRPSA